LEVKVTGEVNPETGFLINLNDLKQLIKTQVEDRYDQISILLPNIFVI